MVGNAPIVVNGKKGLRITLPLCIQSILKGNQNKTPMKRGCLEIYFEYTEKHPRIGLNN